MQFKQFQLPKGGGAELLGISCSCRLPIQDFPIDNNDAATAVATGVATPCGRNDDEDGERLVGCGSVALQVNSNLIKTFATFYVAGDNSISCAEVQEEEGKQKKSGWTRDTAAEVLLLYQLH